MKYEVFSNGVFGSTAYLVYDGEDGVVIDAGVPLSEVKARADELNVKIRALILTHGHYDHIAHACEYKAAGIPVGINKREAYMLSPCRDNLAKYMGFKVQAIAPDFVFCGGEVLSFGKLEFKVVLTAGHTAGSCCFLCDNVCFTGDTLFYGSVGRTDFPTGSHKELMKSIKGKLLVLPGDTIVCPGHNECTTIRAEAESNPYFSD